MQEKLKEPDDTSIAEPLPTTVEPTAAQRAALAAWLAANPYGEQDKNGIDLGAIRRNLRLSPTERLQRLQQAANSMRGLTDARTCH